MRAGLAVSMLAVLAAAGCASRGDLSVAQALPDGVIRFDANEPYRDAVALERIDGIARQSFFFAEPNQRMFRPILEDALENAGLSAGTTQRARYGLSVEVTNAEGPGWFGAAANSEFVANYVLVDRQRGSEVWRREIRTPGAGQFRSGRHGVEGPAYSVAERANHAAVATNVSGFLVAFAADNNVDVTPVLPCWGSPEVEAFKQELLAAGRNFVTDNCAVPR